MLRVVLACRKYKNKCICSLLSKEERKLKNVTRLWDRIMIVILIEIRNIEEGTYLQE